MNANDHIAKLEEIYGQQLDDEQKGEIALWQRGKTLGSIPPFAREEIFEMLREYVLMDADALMAVEPGNEKEILGRHAISHATNKLLVRFTNDFNAALTAGSKTPDVIKQGIRGQVPPESL